MDAADIKAALFEKWPDERYMHIAEAPIDSSRLGTKMDVLVLSLWHSDHHEIDAVEIKCSYSDWKREWLKVEWHLIDHNGRRHASRTKPTETAITYRSGSDRRPSTGWHQRSQEPPADFVPTVERMESLDTSKSLPWRERSHRFWIAAPMPLALRIAEDIKFFEFGWGVLGIGDVPTVVLRPVKNKTPKALTHQGWLGLMRAAADAGSNALYRADAKGYRRGWDEASRIIGRSA